MKKEELNQILEINKKILHFVVLVFLTVLIIEIISNDNYMYCNTDCLNCNQNVSNYGVKVPFLMDKMKDQKEIYDFCESKGYTKNNGILSGSKITCFRYENEETVLKHYDVMIDYVEYLTKKYS